MEKIPACLESTIQDSFASSCSTVPPPYPLNRVVLIEESMLQAEAGADPRQLPLNDSDRKLLASTLMHEEEELTSELLENALGALRRRHLERQQQEVKHQIAQAERQNDAAALTRLVQEKLRIDRELAARQA